MNWTDYDFGKNFFENVIRDEEETNQETSFIIEKLRLKPGAKILDLGCGGGRNAIELAKAGFDVTGMDLNKYAIEFAQNQKSEKLKLDFICMDITNINYNEEFDAIILIFNHFSLFDRIKVKKLLSKISKSLVKDGKLLIEISSLSFGKNLDGQQEWNITEQWLSGKFRQLILTENYFDEEKRAHIRNDFCIRLSDGEIFDYTQVSYLYEPDELHRILKMFDLNLILTYGDWSGKFFEENDNNLILIAKK